jgi:four helix bundle protein
MAWARFEEIGAWQRARCLNQEFWEHFAIGAFGRDFALVDQLNRSLGSIMDNIAEGFDGGSNKEFARFLSYSQRSCSEARSQIYRSEDRGHISPEVSLRFRNELEEIHRMIGGLIRHLRKLP